MRKLSGLFRNYVLRRVDGGQSAAVFWYLPEPPRVVDPASLATYHASAQPSPWYLMDYARKLEYVVTDREGIAALNYGPPLGLQRNPETAFQMALAFHDAGRRDEFLRYAATFLKTQDALGRWSYDFDWYRSHAPWYSALAQGRGASVMLRAWLLTSRAEYRTAALRAISGFGTPIAQQGFVAQHPQAGVPYLEEYPSQPTGVFNGFLTSLFALYEAGRWLDDAQARSWFATYIQSAERMLPFYTTEWWSLYDLDPESPFRNVHSPRYHVLATNYLKVLTELSGSAVFREYRDRWSAMDRPVSRIRAASLKALKKILHR